MKVDWTPLFAAAEHARAHAYAPYSKFQVGVAVLTQDGAVVEGCNVENASFGLTVCAERNALAAVQVLGKKPRAIAIRVDSAQPTPPCGACRQVIAELAPKDLEIRSRTADGQEARYTLAELLPHLFDKSFL